MESIQHATNSDGDIYTLVIADDVYTLTTFEAFRNTVTTTIMRWLPQAGEWASLSFYGESGVDSSKIPAKLGAEIVSEWQNLKKYAEDIVGM